MQDTTRRHLLLATGAAALGTLPGAGHAAMGPNDKFDLLLRNCNVLEPSQRLSGKRPNK